MKKIHIFLIVESVLLAMAIMTILSRDISAFLLLLVVTLLLLRFYNLGSRNNFLLTASFWLLFLVFMLNPYVIVAILFGVVYVLINHFSQVKQKNRRALIQFEEKELTVASSANQWIGEHEPLKRTSYAFDDINIIRLTGNDTIDLTEVIVQGKANHILIRKIYGPTQIIVPIDVSVRLNASCIYGSITFFGYPEYDLRNETITLEEEGYSQSEKCVKLVISVLAGNVEVIRG
ncbi:MULTISPECIES: cell wall-active antibiotics response protein LiaF [Streptococcus]|uniref:Cell wall-active antibiotics response protein LiaF n=1 Tax=Streptococcus caledonicus TaxID=2614158 RepID=A0ABW0UGF5_9STRE|nr:cell wall-active antibiotics response protein LiaF [Streptococcus sp. S784/96/1]